ncbi:hypothetical protein CEXT_565721 [Caerostris extrusa]|uniref:Uncharacterized protein n=1 Tax=Caerostris extrusa TaxID=172846 RepID=A0AAV4QIW9_CAEEX|nr:hypothetical protein CEXT_565721 [Caerostris extrusa]
MHDDRKSLKRKSSGFAVYLARLLPQPEDLILPNKIERDRKKKKRRYKNRQTILARPTPFGPDYSQRLSPKRTNLQFEFIYLEISISDKIKDIELSLALSPSSSSCSWYRSMRQISFDDFGEELKEKILRICGPPRKTAATTEDLILPDKIEREKEKKKIQNRQTIFDQTTPFGPDYSQRLSPKRTNLQ